MFTLFITGQPTQCRGLGGQTSDGRWRLSSSAASVISVCRRL